MYTHLQKMEKAKTKEMYDLAKLICSFINPAAAEKMFAPETESVENVGLMDDLKSLDPRFDMEKYKDFLE